MSLSGEELDLLLAMAAADDAQAAAAPPARATDPADESRPFLLPADPPEAPRPRARPGLPPASEAGPRPSRPFGDAAGPPGKRPDRTPREIFRGFRVVHPAVTPLTVADLFDIHSYQPLSVVGQLGAGATGRWGTMGVLVSKLPPKQTGSGRPFSVWRVQGPAPKESPVTVMLFADAHQAHWQTEEGQVLILLSPSVREKPSETFLAVDSPEQVVPAGRSSDFTLCREQREDGQRCRELVDCRVAPDGLCDYHVRQRAKILTARQPGAKGAQPSVFFGKFRELQNQQLTQDSREAVREQALGLLAAAQQKGLTAAELRGTPVMGPAAIARAALGGSLGMRRGGGATTGAVHRAAVADGGFAARVRGQGGAGCSHSHSNHGLPAAIPKPDPYRPVTDMERMLRRERQRGAEAGDGAGAGGATAPEGAGPGEGEEGRGELEGLEQAGGGEGGAGPEASRAPLPLSQLLSDEGGPATRRDVCEGHLMDREGRSVFRGKRAALGALGPGLQPRKDKAPRTAFAKQFANVEVEEGAASTRPPSRYDGAMRAEAAARAEQALKDAAVLERAAELKQRGRGPSDSLTKRVCRTCKNKVLHPSLSMAQVNALHRNHKIVTETHRAYSFVCPVPGCRSFPQQGWIRDRIVCRTCGAQCRLDGAAGEAARKAQAAAMVDCHSRAPLYMPR